MKNFKKSNERNCTKDLPKINCLLRENKKNEQLQISESVNDVQEKMKAQHIQDMNTLRETLNLKRRHR